MYYGEKVVKRSYQKELQKTKFRVKKVKKRR